MTTPSLTATMFADALQFAIDFKQPIIADPNDLDMLQHRMNLLTEEVEEFIVAEFAGDLVEVADAAVDMLYIAYGTLVALGEHPTRYYVPGPSALPPAFPASHLRIVALARANDLLGDAAGDRYHEPSRASMDAADRAIRLAFDIASAYHLPIDELWDEVHASNMAKKVDGVVVYHPETGKVQKPEGWQPPNIGAVLANHGWVE